MNYARLKALIAKERKQLLRDPFSIAIGILLPIVLLLIFGYGMSMDIRDIELTIVDQHSSRESARLIARFAASEYFHVRRERNTQAGSDAIRTHRADACLYLPQHLLRDLEGRNASFLIVVNAVNATQARMIENYIRSILAAALTEAAAPHRLPLDVAITSRMWYNEANDSSYYMIPGVIVIIMTLIGTLLTALVMAREYEHGNLESMFVTPMKSTEILIAKALNNFFLGLIGLTISLAAARWLFHVPIRGNLLILLTVSGLYLLVSLSLGLLISSITKNQFLACEMTLVLTFMPAFLLSGFLYEIDNMPTFIQWVTCLVPARYYVEFMQSIFLVGNVWPLILKDAAVLSLFCVVFMLLAKIKNPKSLEG